jgi:Ca-activated chloride channel family protein
MKKIGFFVMGILFSLAGLSQEKPSEQGLFLRSGDGELFPAASVGTAVEVRVTGIVARARVTQIFTNPTGKTVEGFYVFPLPDGAAVDTLRMTVGGRVLEGVVRQKQEAAAEYKQAKDEGRRASLVDFERPGVFTTAVANLGPGETVEIALELQQVVEYGRGRFGLRFPLGAAAPTFAFHLDLAPGFPLGRIESSSHDITVAADERRLHYAVDLATGVASAKSDFVLEWAPAVGREPRAVYFTEKIGKERYALLMVMPPEFHPDTADAAAARLPRETVYVIDTSGSMEGDSIEQARKALQLGLDRIAPGDAFDVIRFSGDATALFGQSLPVDSGKVRNARDWVGGFKADGGTNMLAALQLALPQGQAGNLLRQVIFVTDGQVAGEAELLSFIDRHLGESRLFTVAIGSAPNAAFLRKAAARGRGTFTAIDSTGKVAAGMADLFARIETPLLRDVAVRWSDPDAEAWPERISDLYLGEPIVVTARLRGAAGPVGVEGLRGEESWMDEIPAAAEVRGAGLDKLWAGQKVQALLDSLAGGADPDEVERKVTKLGLRYHLLTPYTSLIVVDPEAAPLPEPELPSEDLVEDVITVAAQSPLLDERRSTTGATVSQVELQKVPGARDPWAILQSTPGVLTDRINTSTSPRMASVGSSSPDQTVWTYEICNVFGGPGPVAVSEFEAFEEMQVTTGGSDVTLESPGPQITLIGLRGTNEWRGSGSLAWTGGALAALAGNREERVDGLRAGSTEGGGPLRTDSFWIWSGLSSSEVDRIALGGGAEASARDSATLKLNAELAFNNSMSILVRAGDASGTGAGAAPYRAPETTWEQDGRESLWTIEDTHIVSFNLFVFGHLTGNDGTLHNLPGASGEDGRIDAAGVARGSWFGSDEEQRTREAELSASAFFDTGPASHQVRLGAQVRSIDAERVLTPPGRLVLAGEALGLPAGTALAELWAGGRADAQVETRTLWAQDTASLGRATFNLGLRWDAQDLGPSGVDRVDILQPRLGVTYLADRRRKLALRASASRFASRLGAEPVLSAHPAALRSSAFRFEDLDGDLVLDPGEPSAFAFVRGPLALSPDLAPEITDEATLEAEYSLRPEILVSLQATWRRTSDVLEERWLVRDSSSGGAFTASAADWVRGGSVDGVDWYDLHPGLDWTGGRLLANGDRRRDTFDLALSWQKRLSNRWMGRGHVAWHDWTWRTGPESTRFDDPTPALGGGDLDGQRLLLPAGDSVLPHEPARFLGSRWSFHLAGGIGLPRDVFLSLAVDGREGVPLAGYRQVLRERAGLVRVPVASDRRASDLITADLNLSKDIYLGDFAIIPSLDVFNLLDTGTVAERQTDLGTSRAGQPLRVLAPRTFRLGVRVTWR